MRFATNTMFPIGSMMPGKVALMLRKEKLMSTSKSSTKDTSTGANNKAKNRSSSNSELVSLAKRKGKGSGKYDAEDKVAVAKATKDTQLRSWREPDPEVTEIFRTNLEIRSWAKIDRNNPDEVEERINLYFRTIYESGMKPTVSSLALALGCSRQEMLRIIRESTGKPPAVVTLIQNAYVMINSMTEEYLLNTKVNPVAGIFIMKNNFGYRDQAEVIVKPSNPYGEQKDPDALAKKYLDDMPEILDAEVTEGTDTSDHKNPD